MKHSLKITLYLVLLFLIAQLVGVGVTYQYIDHEVTQVSGNLTFKEPPSVGGLQLETPQLQYPVFVIPLIILIGTLLVLLIIKYRKKKLWTTWFFLSVVACLLYAFGAFVRGEIAFILALVLAYIKVFKKNIFVHNLTEVFIYAGLSAVFVPMHNLTINAMIIILLFIAVYDMYAVWKSKHMVSMATFQSEANLFAGMMLPYKKGRKPKKGEKVVMKKVRTAMLGGGDIGFPLMFTCVVMKTLGLFYGLLIIPFTTLSLIVLFSIAKKDRFYPAMPFLTVGCLLGYGLVLLL